MPTLVMIDGRILVPEEAQISVFDRGFLYGDAVFETIRTYGGVPFALEEHLARLSRSAERVFIELPIPLETLRREVLSVLDASGNAEAYIRIMITRGRGSALGLDPGLASAPVYLVIVAPLEVPPESTYQRGIPTITFRAHRPSDDTEASGAKIANYLVAVLAMRAARQKGASEALLVDRQGRVLEGATSNLFLVRGDTLVTPPEDSGILPGITRSRVLELARDAGLGVELCDVAENELFEADEVFITSSIRELVPVVSVDGRPIGAGVPGRRVGDLLRRFREKARKSVGL